MFAKVLKECARQGEIGRVVIIHQLPTEENDDEMLPPEFYRLEFDTFPGTNRKCHIGLREKFLPNEIEILPAPKTKRKK